MCSKYFLQRFAVFLMVSHICSVLGYHDSTATVGYSALERDSLDSVSNKVLLPDAEQTFDEDGKVISFNYFSGRTGEDIKFQIWRPVSGSRYELIYSSNTVTTNSTSTGSFVYYVTGNVWGQAGDTIGLYIAGDNPVTYSEDTSCTLMEYPQQGQSGSTVTFSDVTTSECRTYSINAEIVYDNVDATTLNCTYLTAVDSFQFLQSSNYDGSTEYYDDTHECWLIEADSSDKGVRVTFATLDMEDPYAISGECANDFLEFHDGEDFWTDILTELCGNDYPEYGVNSTQKYMYFRMVSDDNNVNGLGFQLLYKSYELDSSSESEKKDEEGVDVAVILCVVFAVIALLLIIPIIILWVKTKRTRDREAKDRLKDNDFLELEQTRQAAWSPRPTTARTPRPVLDLEEHRKRFLQSKAAKNVPQAAEYSKPRQPEGAEGIKVKHWSKLTAGVRWNPVKKQFTHDSNA